MNYTVDLNNGRSESTTVVTGHGDGAKLWLHHQLTAQLRAQTYNLKLKISWVISCHMPPSEYIRPFQYPYLYPAHMHPSTYQGYQGTVKTSLHRRGKPHRWQVEYVSILALEVATFDMIWQWFAKPQARTFLVRSFWDPDDLMFPDPNNWECEWCFTLRAWQALFSQSICIKPVFFHCMDIKEAVRELRNRGLNCWSQGSTGNHRKPSIFHGKIMGLEPINFPTRSIVILVNIISLGRPYPEKRHIIQPMWFHQ